MDNNLPKLPSMFNPFSPHHEIYQTTSNIINNSNYNNCNNNNNTHNLVTQNDIVPQLNNHNNNLNLNCNNDNNNNNNHIDIDIDIIDNLLQIPSTLFIENNNNSNEIPNKHRKASLLNDDDDDDDELNPKDMKKKKKIVHREIERQRRFEMSTLHATLRSLLPHDYIKGKRAISDHLGEAVKYISHLQQNIKQLQDHREALKREVYSSKTRDRDVKIKSCKGGFDVIVSTSCEVNNGDGFEGLPLSKVIQCLIQQGLDVVACVSHRVDNSKMVHSIKAQYFPVEDGNGRSAIVDTTNLQQKLEDL